MHSGKDDFRNTPFRQQATRSSLSPFSPRPPSLNDISCPGLPVPVRKAEADSSHNTSGDIHNCLYKRSEFPASTYISCYGELWHEAPNHIFSEYNNLLCTCLCANRTVSLFCQDAGNRKQKSANALSCGLPPPDSNRYPPPECRDH